MEDDKRALLHLRNRQERLPFVLFTGHDVIAAKSSTAFFSGNFSAD